MITVEGYSKDPNIVPEGIVITFGKDMLSDHGGLRTFLKSFKKCLDADDYWIHFCKNKPKFDIIYVYIIISNRLAYRCHFGGWDVYSGIGYKANGDKTNMKNGIALAGPLVKCPFKRELKGFRNFRYSTKLF
jgi:hypothetical protein